MEEKTALWEATMAMAFGIHSFPDRFLHYVEPVPCPHAVDLLSLCLHHHFDPFYLGHRLRLLHLNRKRTSSHH